MKMIMIVHVGEVGFVECPRVFFRRRRGLLKWPHSFCPPFKNFFSVNKGLCTLYLPICDQFFKRKLEKIVTSFLELIFFKKKGGGYAKSPCGHRGGSSNDHVWPFGGEGVSKFSKNWPHDLRMTPKHLCNNSEFFHLPLSMQNSW